MRFISILALFLLCNGCFTNATSIIIHSNSENDPPIDRELQPSIPNGTVKPKTTFIDLNTDVLFLIFTQFNLNGLLNITKAIPEMLPVAQGAFRRNYNNYIVRIQHADMNMEPAFFENVDRNHIDIFDFQMSVDILKNFGPSISKLKVRNTGIQDDHSATISQLINDHCTESLTHLNLHFIKPDTLQYFTKLFSNVGELILYIAYQQQQIQIGNLTLSQLFPELNSLRLSIHAVIDYSFIDCKFTHLKNLVVSTSNGGLHRIDHVTELLKKNSQIQSLSLEDFPHDYIEIVSKYLPRLEILQLTVVAINPVNSVHFEHVKYFKMGFNHPNCLDKLSFSRLESLDFRFQERQLSEWVQFFARHQNLSRLVMSGYIGGLELPLVELTANLSNLKEVSIKCVIFRIVEMMNQFFANHENVTKFQIVSELLDFDEMARARQHFSNDWHIEDINDGLSFERKVIE